MCIVISILDCTRHTKPEIEGDYYNKQRDCQPLCELNNELIVNIENRSVTHLLLFFAECSID